MKKLSYTFAAFIMALIVLSCSNENNTGADKAALNSSAEERTYPVKVQKIQKQNITRTLDYTANLIAYKEIHAAPASPGRISKINVEVGSRVSKGQILIVMDKTQLNQAETQLANALYTFQQIDTLYRLQSISEQQFEQAKTQYELAKSNVEFLKENTTLQSPINGIVTGKYYENGEIYSGAPNTEAGKAAVISLMQINPLKAIVNISQSFFPNVKNGMDTKVTTDIYPDNVFEGKVSKVYPTINSSTRTFLTEVLVRNNEELLRPGMFTNIQMDLNDEEIMVVPAIAVLKQEGTNERFVFIEKNGIAQRVKVSIGKRIDDQIEIIANGVQEGMDIVVEGQANLLDGSKVEISTK